MGLDFGIAKYTKDGAVALDDVAYGRNCHLVRQLIIPRLKTYDEDKCTAKLTLSDLNDILSVLLEETKNNNFHDEFWFDEDDMAKVYKFISDVAFGIYDAYQSKAWNDIEYDYELYDSY